MNARSTGGDHVLHQFESIQHATETGFGVSNDRQEVVDEFLVARVHTTRPLDFVSALEGVVDTTNHGRYRVVSVQRLIRVHGFRGVTVGGNLPARQVNSFQTSLGLLHGLTGGDGAESINVALLGAAVDFVPQNLGTALGQGVFRLQRAAQTDNVSSGVTALNVLPAGVFSPVFFQGGDLLFASCHVDSFRGEVARESALACGGTLRWSRVYAFNDYIRVLLQAQQLLYKTQDT